MQEVRAESPIVIEGDGNRCIIRIPGDQPPVGALVVVGASALFIPILISLVVGVGLLSMLFYIILAALPVLALVHFARKKHGREQVVVIEDGKLQALGKSFLLSDVSAVELGNAHSATPLMTFQGIAVGNGLGVGIASATFAMHGAISGAMSLVVQSAAKKAYYVRIRYGTKSYYIAKELREPRARALYAVLTNS